MSNRILVTGAGGYLGQEILKHLGLEGVETIGFYRREPAGPMPGESEICELTDAASVERLIVKTMPSAVIHAAAWIGSDTRDGKVIAQAVDGNVKATAILTAACAKARVGRLIFCSSVEVYGAAPQNGLAHKEDDKLDPQGLYGRTKAAAEYVVRALEDGATVPYILRMPGLHGGSRKSGIVHRLLAASAEGSTVELAEPESKLSILWVADAARAVSAAARGMLPASAVIRNIASGNSTILELARGIERFSGRALDIHAGAAPARNRVLDDSLIRSELSFRLTSLEEGLQREIGMAVTP